jgi:hypothetical protein
MAQYIPYRWQIFGGERGYGLQRPLDSLFHTKKNDLIKLKLR